MSLRVLRLFLSSPGDVAVERRRVAAVVSRLNGEFAGRALIETVRWETEAYQAHTTFQAQIPHAVGCDLVLAIFKWRLGTELPPDFPDRLETGEPYPSGTAYELLTSIEQRRRGGPLPDIFVYRFAGSSPRLELEDPNRDRIERDWSALKGFFERWFLTPEGHFRAAFQTYGSEDDFEAQVEPLLRKWLADKVASGRAVAWPDAVKGSPFPGLEAYGHRHAAVFFGRSRDTARGVELWRESESRGTAFLAVVGSSGSGKSSLARAGLVPRLTTPGVVEAVDGWRVATLRPGDGQAGPVAALAAALLAEARDLPVPEEGRGPALPEIAAGDARTPAELAELMAGSDRAAARTVVNALDRIGAALGLTERIDRAVRCDLVLVVDQLDEIFAPAVTDQARDGFVRMLAALLATGRVWVVATLRADLYAALLDHPGLRALKEAGQTLDLAPPGPAELAEIVRRPAEAAGLAFERDPVSGESVDERLLAEADRPDMLPLVQLALARLYEGRRRENQGQENQGQARKGRKGQENRGEEGDRVVLPADVYAGLGGLSGIIDEAGERALAGLDPEAATRLPQLTRGLAELGSAGGPLAGTLSVRPVALAVAAPDAARRRLVDALVAARLLTVSGAGAGGQVRLAHQRVLTDWARVREIVAGSQDFYRIHADVERQRLRWEANRRSDLLLPRGLPLAEAESIVGRYGDDLGPETRDFIRASRKRAGRGQVLTAAAAVVFAAVAAGALLLGGVAREQTRLAESNFAVAREAVRGVVFDIVQGLGDVSGMRVDALRTILATVRTASDTLAVAAPGDPGLLRTRGAMFDNFARLYAALGDIPAARASAEQAVAIMRGLLESRPEDVRVEGDLSIPLVTQGNIAFQSGDLALARRLFREALALARVAGSRAPDDPELRRRIAPPLSRLGDVLIASGDYSGALAAYRELIALSRREVAAEPLSGDRRYGLVLVLNDYAYVGMVTRDFDLARAGYGEAGAIARALATEFPASPGMQRALSLTLSNLGRLDLELGHPAEAVGRFDEAVAIERALLRADPENGERLRTLAVALESRGQGATALEDGPAALRAHTEQLAIMRGLAARAPYDLRNRRSVAIALGYLGPVRRATGDEPAAATALAERLDIFRALAAGQQESAEARRDLAIALRDMSETRRLAGDRAGAIALRGEAVGLARVLATIDPEAVAPLLDLHELLRGFAQLQIGAADNRAALASLEEEVPVLRRLIALQPKATDHRLQLGRALTLVGFLKNGLDDEAGTRSALDEARILYRGLVAEEPSARRPLDVVLDALAKIDLSFGHEARARDVLLELVRLRRDAVSRDATAAGRIALADALVRLARLDPEPAPLLREVLAVLDAVPETERTADAREARSEAETRVGAGPRP